jgi:hypothetical protein
MNDDFISSSMDTGMRIPPADGGDGGITGGVGGIGGGGELPSVGSMRWARNLSRSRLQVTGRDSNPTIYEGPKMEGRRHTQNIVAVAGAIRAFRPPRPAQRREVAVRASLEDPCLRRDATARSPRPGVSRREGQGEGHVRFDCRANSLRERRPYHRKVCLTFLPDRLGPRTPREMRKRFAIIKCVSRYTCDTRFRDSHRSCARGQVGSADCSYIHVQNQGQQA